MMMNSTGFCGCHSAAALSGTAAPANPKLSAAASPSMRLLDRCMLVPPILGAPNGHPRHQQIAPWWYGRSLVSGLLYASNCNWVNGARVLSLKVSTGECLLVYCIPKYIGAP